MRDYLGYVLFTKALPLLTIMGGAAVFVLKLVETSGELGSQVPHWVINLLLVIAAALFLSPLGAAGELANIIRELRDRRTTANDMRDQINRSIYLHAKLLNGVDSKRDDAMGLPLLKRQPDERRVMFDSLRLIESVLRERIRLHKHTDIRTSLLVKRKNVVCYRCREIGEDIEDNFEYELKEQHTSFLDAMDGVKLNTSTEIRLFYPDGAVHGTKRLTKNSLESVCFGEVANIESDLAHANQYIDINGKVHVYRSILVVDFSPPGSSLILKIMFESRRRYEFGSRQKNKIMVRDLLPFFMIVRLAMQYPIYKPRPQSNV